MIRKISTFILALISTIGINLKLDKDLNFIESLTGNDITYIFIFFAFIILIDKALNNKDKRLTIISIILSLLFGIFEILGHSIVNYGDFSGILLNGTVKFKNIFKLIAYVTISYSAINVLFSSLAKNTEKENKKDIKIFTNNKLSIFTVAFTLLILWIPYYLRHFPGILGIDACNQLEQATGMISLSSHHPIFITLLIKLIITITTPIFNNMTISVAIIILLKMIIMVFGISIAIYYLAKKNISIKIRLLILTFFAINPVIPVVGMLFSSGFCLWMFLIIIFYTIYRKRYDIILMQLPFIINYLIVIAGPSNTEFRYILPLYIALPVLFSLTIKELKMKEKNKYENSSTNTML